MRQLGGEDFFATLLTHQHHFLSSLDAQRSLLTLQDSMTSSTALVSSDMVRLYKALGGGWRTEAMIPAAERAVVAP